MGTGYYGFDEFHWLDTELKWSITKIKQLNNEILWAIGG